MRRDRPREAVGRDAEPAAAWWDDSAGYASGTLTGEVIRAGAKPAVLLCWQAEPDCSLHLANASKNEAPDFSSRNRGDK